MAKQLILPVKGTRDFYPEEMAFRNWLYGKIKKVSQKFGFQEFDGPNIEYLNLYLDKTNEEILKEQAFSLKDRDGRDILLRPEITPTLARMVAQKANQLIKPIKWFSFGRCWRYEQPQKGRTREFFQWEIDILGPETPEADAEILAIAVEYFKELGLTKEEVVIKVNDRAYFERFCASIDLSPDQTIKLIRIIDKKCKMTGSWFENSLKEIGLKLDQIDKINEYLADKDYSKSERLEKVFRSLKNYPETLDFVKYDPLIARGFDYYTGVVFEAWAKKGTLKRALFGGGRFDNLTATLGGKRIPAQGMAPGDVPIQVLLEDLGKMPDLKPEVASVLVTVFSPELMDKSLVVCSRLRSNNVNCELWLDAEDKLDKQLKYADQKGIPYAVIIGPDEAHSGQVTLKDLTKQTQQTLALDEALTKLSS